MDSHGIFYLVIIVTYKNPVVPTNDFNDLDDFPRPTPSFSLGFSLGRFFHSKSGGFGKRGKPSPDPEPRRCLRLPHLRGFSPQRPEMKSGADDALLCAAPSALLPRARRFDENGPARTLDRRSWFHVQAMKADKPRLSACPSKVNHPRLHSGCGLLCWPYRWSLSRHKAGTG